MCFTVLSLTRLAGEKIIIGDYDVNNITKIKDLIKEENINKDDVVLDIIKISLASSSCHDVLSHVYYFNNKSSKVHILNSKNHSFIIPSEQYETIVRLYCKNKNNMKNFENIIELWNNTHF